eukprot:gene23212-30087_t
MSSYAMNDQDILLLPFRRRVGKYSLKQVEMMNLTANMFVYANTHMRHHIWRLLSPEVYASFLDRVFPVTQMLTSLLSVPFSSFTHLICSLYNSFSQYRLSSWFSAISKSEKAAENFALPLDSTGLPADCTSPRKLSIAGQADAEAIDIRKNPPSPVGFDLDGAGAQSVGNLFLLEVEASIVSAMLALTSFIRQITPEPIDSSCILGSNALHYTVGSKVFYLSDRFLDIAQHPSNLLDSYVPVSSVKYTSAPLLTFWSYADLFHNASRNAHQDSGNAADGPCLSTAHLLRCLRVTLSPTTALRLCRTYATTSADNKEEASGKNKTNRRGSLDENGFWNFVTMILCNRYKNLNCQNIAHHAHAPLGRESSMIHQLTEVRRLIRMRGDSSLGSGAMSISRVPALFRQSSRLTSPSSTLSHSGNSSAVAGGGGG